MLILLKIKDIDWSEFVIGEYHFSNSLSFLWSLVVFDVWVLKDVSVVDHELKAVINNFSIFLTIDEVSHFISIEWVGSATLDYSGRFRIVEM
jgi:hypothetical protein